MSIRCVMLLALALTAAAQGQQPPATAPAETDPASTRPATRPAEPEALKVVFPPMLAGLPRGKLEFNPFVLGDFRMAAARTEYADDSSAAAVSVEVLDYAAHPKTLAQVADWLGSEIDRSDDRELQRTLSLGGWPALQTYDAHRRTGSLAIVVADRYLVNVTTYEIPAEAMAALADVLGLEELAQVK